MPFLLLIYGIFLFLKIVQPSELVNNIYLNDYKSIKYYKVDSNILGELIFEESTGKYTVEVALKYVYNAEKMLLRIEEEVHGQVNVLWDRNNTESELINEIISLLKQSYSTNEVNKFITSLPNELAKKLMLNYKLTA